MSVADLRAMGFGDGLDDATLSGVLNGCGNDVGQAIDTLAAMALQEQERAAAAANSAAHPRPQQPQDREPGGGGGVGGLVFQPPAPPAVPAQEDGANEELDEDEEEMMRLLLGDGAPPPSKPAAPPPRPTPPPAAAAAPPPAAPAAPFPASSFNSSAAPFNPAPPQQPASPNDGFQMVGRRQEGGEGGGGGQRGPGVRLVVLVGPPGCGKSTAAGRFRAEGWEVVSQDELGTRHECETAASQFLCAGMRVVIDRTNIDELQRSHWVNIAGHCRIPTDSIVCLNFDVPLQVCKQRVMSRTGHRTLPADKSSLAIVDRFAGSYVRPREREGFARVISVRGADDQAVQQLIHGFV